MVHDLEPGAAPKTTFGLVTEALVRRRQRGVPPFTVLSCDNIQGNGDVARRSFTAFARLKDPKLGEWVEQEVRFPNCMVDRITPVTTDDDRAALAERFGVEDELAGGVRAVHPVGARGRLRPRAAAAGGRRARRSSTTSSRTS